MFSIWVCSRLLTHAHGPPGSGAQAGRAPTAARLSGWSSAVGSQEVPAREAAATSCGFTQGMCVSARSKTTLVLQSGCRCTASRERERLRGHKTSIAHLVAATFAHLLPLRAVRAFLELSVDRAAKNSPRQALPPALPCPNTEVARPDIDSTVCYLWLSAPSTSL